MVFCELLVSEILVGVTHRAEGVINVYSLYLKLKNENVVKAH